jgi:hypothetical protein
MLVVEEMEVIEIMKKMIPGLFFSSVMMFMAAGCFAEDASFSKELQKYQQMGVVEYGDNEMLIAFDGIGMPLGKILLIRKDNQFCAVKFTKFWTENNRTEKYALYEAYHPKDGTTDFSETNLQISERKASYLIPRGPFRPLLKQYGHPRVDCGSLRLIWNYKGYVAMNEGYESKDEGIELAPTLWTSLSEINLSDSRLMWYKYDERRGNGYRFPVDRLWHGK